MRHSVRMRRMTAVVLSMMLACSSVPTNAFALTEADSQAEDMYLVQESGEEDLGASLVEDSFEDGLFPEEAAGVEVSSEESIDDSLFPEEAAGEEFSLEESVEDGMSSPFPASSTTTT